MIRTQYLGGQKTTTHSVCHNYFGEDATYETNIDCALAGQSDFIRLHAYADTNTWTQRDTVAHCYRHANPQRDTVAHCYRHANKHTHQHAIPDPYGDENARTIPNGYTYVSTH
jgi:hypothetical protein